MLVIVIPLACLNVAYTVVVDVRVRAGNRLAAFIALQILIGVGMALTRELCLAFVAYKVVVFVNVFAALIRHIRAAFIAFSVVIGIRMRCAIVVCARPCHKRDNGYYQKAQKLFHIFLLYNKNILKYFITSFYKKQDVYV
jgi:hypothetical protein